jgi:hypothetical protein
MSDRKISRFIREAMEKGKERAFKPSRDYKCCSFRTEPELSDREKKFGFYPARKTKKDQADNCHSIWLRPGDAAMGKKRSPMRLPDTALSGNLRLLENGYGVIPVRS